MNYVRDNAGKLINIFLLKKCSFEVNFNLIVIPFLEFSWLNYPKENSNKKFTCLSPIRIIVFDE